MVLGLWQFEVVEHSDDLCGGGVSGAQTISSANDKWLVLCVIECRLDIQIQWLAFCARLFGAVEHGNSLDRLWYGLQQVSH